LFRRCKPHDTAEPLPGRSKVHELSAPESGPLAQGLLEVILNQAYLDRLPENDGGIVTIHLESWQIDVLAMFGIIIKTDPQQCRDLDQNTDLNANRQLGYLTASPTTSQKNVRQRNADLFQVMREVELRLPDRQFRLSAVSAFLLMHKMV